MKRITLLLLLALFFSLSSYSQQATLLRKGRTIAVFEGTESFVTAYEASHPGDQIMLSEGVFQGPLYLTKSLRIIGVGEQVGDENLAKQTVIDSSINIYDTSASGIYLEGICFKKSVFVSSVKKGATISRCYLNYFNIINSQYCTIANNRIDRVVISSSNYITIANSVIDDRIEVANSTTIQIQNNVLLKETIDVSTGVFDFYCSEGVHVLNNIVFAQTGDELWENNSSHRVVIENNLFTTQPKQTHEDLSFYNFKNNYIEPELNPSKVFQSFNRKKVFQEQDFHLKQTNWRGKEGKELGLYGKVVELR